MTARQSAARVTEGAFGMEALRLIKTARHALAETRNIPDVLAEARQAALLAEAVGTRLGGSEYGELSGLGQLLAETALHAACCLDHATGDVAGASAFGPGSRARRLGELGELGPMLDELGGLLRDIGETLVVLACGADTESLYWACIDGVDAGAECTRLVAQLRDAVRSIAGERPEEDELAERLLLLQLDPPGERAEVVPAPVA
ncbi:DUF6099 family protein [Kitasatospora sp. NPDC057595]|uniref:DUF6099 family protein n=1 Tax=Kitasatospora sp. NPDC057595 TaxID=3346177 RepID=UPI00369B7F24